MVTVLIRYGPYSSFDGVKYRIQRLQGLTNVLKTAGHTIVYEEIADWNEVQLIVHGELIYRCEIQELQYGGDGLLDRKCKDALTAVTAAY
ncbi:UPF0728 protein C10orf53-like protein [Trichoplax sp. H2]|nr:UPF0728 protein C10orf53-like protein [Trichoplax sp. H2]|eukprot:RDD41453.1 UPF0728 protein C10orf53-like protein [Trichoplax sp. H2]